MEATNDRGFMGYEPVETAYGAVVRVYESSSAMGPHIWLNLKQPPPAYGGALDESETTAHMSLRQAELIHKQLGEMIEYVKEAWDESAWYDEES